MKTTLTYKFSRYIVKNKIRSIRDIIWYIRNVHRQKRRNSCLKRVPTEVKNVLKPLDIPRLSVMWVPSISKSCRVTFFLFGRSLLNIKQNFEDYNNLIFANSIKRVILFLWLLYQFQLSRSLDLQSNQVKRTAQDSINELII